MFQASGFLDDRTWSVARAIFAKSVMKTGSSIAKVETTNLPVTKNAMATKVAFRIERLEGNCRDRRNGVEDVTLSGRGEERQVDRILFSLLGRERSGEQYVGFRRVVRGDRIGDGQLVHRNRARFVRAEHVHRRGILGGAEERRSSSHGFLD
jgi:hypothetical protein